MRSDTISFPLVRRGDPKLLREKRVGISLGVEGGFCDNRIPTARKSLILNGEMSEWLSAYAAKPLRRDITP